MWIVLEVKVMKILSELIKIMKKELTPEQKADLRMKYEIAEELGLLDKITENGWKGLTSRESGRIGGIMGKRKRAQMQEGKNEKKADE